MTIEVYTFERADGTALDYSTQSPADAREYARARGARVIANTYECTDSEPVSEWDFTHDESAG